MLLKILCATPLVAALLLGCTSDNPSTQTEVGNSVDRAFLAALSCGISSSSVTPADAVQTAMDSETTTQQQVSCSEEADTALTGPGIGNTGTGSLNFRGNETALSAATTDEDNYNNVSDLILFLHDGNTRSLRQSGSSETQTDLESRTRIDWGLYDATIAFSASLTQINTATFTGGSFDVRAPSTDGQTNIPTDTNTANFATLIRDINGNGVADAETETEWAASGNINVSGESPNWSVTLEVTLEDGTSVTGVYVGSFLELPVF